MLSKFKNNLRTALFLSFVDFKLKNERAYLGIFWYLLEPLFFFVAIMAIRGALQVESIENYAVYLITGLVMFNFFRNSTSTAAKVIRFRAQFIKSMRVSPTIFVISNCLQSVYSHFFEIIILSLILLYYGLPLGGLFLYLAVFIALLIFSLGVSFIVAPLGAFSDDFNNVWQLLLRVLFFLTPIFYKVSENTSLADTINLNPLTHFISLGRDALIDMTLSSEKVLFLFLISFAVLGFGVVFFNYLKKYFAEWI